MPSVTPNYGLSKPYMADNSDISRINENFDVLDEILCPVIDQSSAPPSDSLSAKLHIFLGWIANRIKSITGKSNWWESPGVTLETCKTHIEIGTHANATNTTAGFMSALDKQAVSGATADLSAGKIVARDASGRAKIMPPVEDNDIATKKYVDDTAKALISIPTGVMVPYAGLSVPSGWLECAGQAVSRTTYANLFAAIGTTFGAGDGVTTFRLPNMPGKTIVGRDMSDSDFSATGKTGGEKAHLLTVNEMPSHAHKYYPKESTSKSVVTSCSPPYQTTTVNSQIDALATDSFSTGGGQVHNNMQPYIVFPMIIKI